MYKPLYFVIPEGFPVRIYGLCLLLCFLFLRRAGLLTLYYKAHCLNTQLCFSVPFDEERVWPAITRLTNQYAQSNQCDSRHSPSAVIIPIVI